MLAPRSPRIRRTLSLVALVLAALASMATTEPGWDVTGNAPPATEVYLATVDQHATFSSRRPPRPARFPPTHRSP